MTETRVAGLLLAAGAGRRFGMPKALARLDGEPLLLRALRALTDGGCAPVYVVVGARAGEVRALLPPGVRAVHAHDWADGMGESLRAGLDSLRDQPLDAVLVHLVDVPGVHSGHVARLRELGGSEVVARAGYHGQPGHPVLLGGRWLPQIAAGAHQDVGAREWLAGRDDLRIVECADLGTGEDVDTPSDLPADVDGGPP